MNILLTGGTGYIASHTAVVLSEAGHEVILYDNLCNSQIDVLDKLERILSKKLSFVQGDVRDTNALSGVMKAFNIEAVIHFAGLKAVGESVEKPIEYYDNNIGGTVSLIKAMQANKVDTLVFSSSATVYGEPQYLPLDEKHPTSATNPYGRTKLHIEEMLSDVAKADASLKVICLRYFNPVGAHDSGLIGENPNGIPNNLMPYIARVASGKLPYLKVFGDDYPTHDGTGVRDYIHVMDLAEGHYAALNFSQNNLGFYTFNLGTGKGHSVLEVIKAYEKASNKKVPYQMVARRSGDVASCFADASLAKQHLNWQATRCLEQMCQSTAKFQANKHEPIAVYK